MTEQFIERRAMDALISQLDGSGLTGQYSIYGSLQPGLLKSMEDSTRPILVVVKVSPRSYESPMSPTARMELTVTAQIRADMDYEGKGYLDVCDALMRKYECW